ncbi:MAG: MotA/TolQ/ExbB proton channel family protein [Thermoguttaceae bacterium]|nr:MotA/TolQ/ExbB proton channel family protein [Thermoguttaceae bacterium]
MRNLFSSLGKYFEAGSFGWNATILLILFGTIVFCTWPLLAQDDLFSGAPDTAAPAKQAAPAKANPVSAPPVEKPAAPAADPAPAPPAAQADAPSAPAADAAASAPAAATADTNSTSERQGDNYLVWMMKSLGWFFSPVFIVMSLTMVAIMVMNCISIRRANLVPEELVRRFGTLLDEAKYQDAYQVAKDDDSLLGKVLSSGLSRMQGGYDKAVQGMQDVAQEETMRLEHQLGYLSLIGNLAPMIGLFGTVVGMIDAFQVIAAGGSAPSPQKLAEGIATAMFTTMVGLAIALPSLAFYDIFRNRLARFTLEIGIISDNFMSRFSSMTPRKP